MKYALDSNIGLKWVWKEPDSPAAVRLRDFIVSLNSLA
jgi:hypothetical protein